MNVLTLARNAYRYEIDGKPWPDPHFQTDYLVDGDSLGQLFRFESSRPWFGQTCFEDGCDHLNALVLQLRGLTPSQNQFGTDRFVLYRCHCGDDNCGIVSCRVQRYDNVEYKGIDVLSPAFILRMLEKNEPLNTILIYMSQGIDAKKHHTWPEGMWLAWHCFATADLSMAKEANPAYAFGHRMACWPEPLLSCLKQVGAVKFAEMFTSWQKVLFEGQHVTLTGNAASNYAANQFDRYDNTKCRKQWREGVKATGEDLEQLTRKYLLEHPLLFQSK